MERIRHSEITALEIWDLCLDGRTLGEFCRFSDTLGALWRAIEMLHAGLGATRSSGLLPSIVSGFEAVFLTGGRAKGTKLRNELSGLPCAIVHGRETSFGGERGGFDFLQAHGLSGWVADLGKSRLKLAAPERRWTFPRDWTRLRLAGDVPLAEEPAQRRRLREFIAIKLQLAMMELGRRPRALVFALPTKLNDDGTPHRSNYAGMSGDRMLLPDALQMAGLAGLPLFVLNDAELAALSALADPRLARFRKVLVLTLGFGIGAALIHRANCHPGQADG